MATTAIISHADAKWIVTDELTDSPATRTFLKTGKLTPGFRAAVNLHAIHVGDIQPLVAYVDARVAAGTTAAPASWPQN